MWGDLGFETIGNATLIVHDGGPVLATDPWLGGSAYFGSWSMTHAVPEEQATAIRDARFVFISHGHPDHLHMPSLADARGQRILLADHAGGRLRDDLLAIGFDVEVMPDRVWKQLSTHVRVMAIADQNQDSVLVVDLDGTLVIDANDATDHGWGYGIRRIAHRRTAPVFLLALSGYGDADMINFFDEAGTPVPPPAARRLPPGPAIARRMHRLGARFFVPFSSMHRYQRADSVWANAHVTPLGDHAIGFDAPGREMTPAFIRYDRTNDMLTTIDPEPNPLVIRASAEFGDDWSEQLEAGDVALLRKYFETITTLRGVVGEIVFRVGGREERIVVDHSVARAVTFEVPRRSLVDAVTSEVFDDLLIGNFMRTTLHGDWSPACFSAEFARRVAKYSDNGRAHSAAEVEEYLDTYRRRAPIDAFRFGVRRRAASIIRGA